MVLLHQSKELNTRRGARLASFPRLRKELTMKSYQSILPSQTSNLQLFFLHCWQGLAEQWQFYQHLAISQWDPHDDNQ